jgi:diguanylate cyclase (GGDEF)-like protein
LSLQRRLTLFFIIIVILPLAAAGVVVQRIVVHEIGRRAAVSLGPTLDAAVTLYNERQRGLENQMRWAVAGERFAAVLAEGRKKQVDAYLVEALNRAYGIDYLIVTAPDDSVVGFANHASFFAPGVEPPGPDALVGGPAVGPGYTGITIPLAVEGRGIRGSLQGGFWLDADLLVEASNSDVDLSLVESDRVIASSEELTNPTSLDVPGRAEFETELGGPVLAQGRSLGRAADDLWLVATAARVPGGTLSSQVLTSILGLLALALIGTALLGYMLARLITRPLEELAEGAQAISRGRFGYKIPVRSKDEVGRVAEAFNEMSNELEESMGELQSSRDQLQLAVRRVGETLRSTHDMTQIRESIVNTAADAVGSDAAILWTFTPTREELLPTVARDIDPDTLERVKVGSGIVGLAAERAVTVILPAQPGGPKPARGEPDFPIVIATPIFSQDRVASVLVNYRSKRAFTADDIDTVKFLVEQGGVAIENVFLHEDAQRLSLTDGLTGVWNRRYLQMQFRQMLATSHRFGRPFSVLMLDLDHFKAVNDTYGHQRGDVILVEFAQRVKATLREVDTFARYGGEEFVCLLSETGREGATAAAGKILHEIKSVPFGGHGEETVNLTVSIGIATFPKHGDSYRVLVEAADQAMYEAKQQGRDRYRIARDPSPDLRLA